MSLCSNGVFVNVGLTPVSGKAFQRVPEKEMLIVAMYLNTIECIVESPSVPPIVMSVPCPSPYTTPRYQKVWSSKVAPLEIGRNPVPGLSPSMTLLAELST